MDPTTALVKAISTSCLAVARFLVEEGDLRSVQEPYNLHKRALYSP